MTQQPPKATHPIHPNTGEHSVDAYVSIANSAGRIDEPVPSTHGPQSNTRAPQSFVAVTPSPYCHDKHRIDWWMTLALSTIALPIIAFTAAAIMVLDGRPIFYRQVRVGRNGRHFRIWKFRTMRPDAEQHTGAVWSNQSDPRVTRLGRWLRCSHLDELPQFFNILRGDMNLVGPRPERPEFARELSRELPGYSQRTLVHPGITGLAQLSLGYDEQMSEVGKKVALDVRYIRMASFRLDLSLLVWTAPYIAHQIGTRISSTMQRWSQKSSPSKEVVPLVSPDAKPERADLPKPHYSKAGQSRALKSGDSNRRSA